MNRRVAIGVCLELLLAAAAHLHAQDGKTEFAMIHYHKASAGAGKFQLRKTGISWSEEGNAAHNFSASCSDIQSANFPSRFGLGRVGDLNEIELRLASGQRYVLATSLMIVGPLPRLRGTPAYAATLSLDRILITCGLGDHPHLASSTAIWNATAVPAAADGVPREVSFDVLRSHVEAASARSEQSRSGLRLAGGGPVRRAHGK